MKENCKGCFYLSASKSFCLLGRREDKCKSNNARRGDDKLISRLKSIPVDEYRAS